MAVHNELGKAGEDAAVDMLRNKGYRILERNWKIGRKELDIIASKDQVLVVVEVKTRKNDRFGSPVDAITEAKMQRMMQAANAYVRYRKLDCPVRFDVVSVVDSPAGLVLDHIEDAFYSPIW